MTLHWLNTAQGIRKKLELRPTSSKKLLYSKGYMYNGMEGVRIAQAHYQ